ncbi:S8 family peptidase [Peptococcaceae bacterium 1198_IL3148]
MEKIIVFKAPVFNRHGMVPALSRLLSRSGAERIQSLPLINGILCHLPQQFNEKTIKDAPEVLALEDNVRVKLRPFTLERRWPFFANPWKKDQVIPWGVDRIGANKVWNYSRGENVRVAVLDSGIDLDHPDLVKNIKGGINILNQTPIPEDDNGHGTHVAGTIAAEDNATGVVGVAPAVDIYAVKIIDNNGDGTLADIIKGIDWCIRNRMQIANLSVGTDRQLVSLKVAVTNAYRAGLIMVSAAGNDGINNSVDFPGAYPEVISVGAVDQHNQLAPFSSRGPEVTVIAPGSGIYSTSLNGTFLRLSGTSMATPHVTGLIALALKMNPRITTNKLIEMFKQTCDKLQLTSSEQGFGLINAERFLQAVLK